MSNETTSDVLSLDHVNILTNDLAACRHFYVEVLNFTEGFRPPFDFPGLWIYLSDSPVLHFIQTDELQPENSGTIDHVAFRAKNFDSVSKRLKDNDIDFEHKSVPDMDLQQIFCYDPHGIKIEFNFHG